MKKYMVIFIAVHMLMFSACSQSTEKDTETHTDLNIPQFTTEIEDTEADTEMTIPEEETEPVIAIQPDSLDELEDQIESYFETVISQLENEWEELKISVDTYDKYCENTDIIEKFYTHIVDSTEIFCADMCRFALDCAVNIIESEKKYDDMYEDLEMIYDSIYDDVGDEIYDNIYNGILDEMYSTLYSEILDDAYDYVPYSEWADARSDEYDWWSDARSEVYDYWSDTRSDIYDFWTDLRSEMWDKDLDGAIKDIDSFREDVEKLVNK